MFCYVSLSLAQGDKGGALVKIKLIIPRADVQVDTSVWFAV